MQYQPAAQLAVLGGGGRHQRCRSITPLPPVAGISRTWGSPRLRPQEQLGLLSILCRAGWAIAMAC